MRIVGYVREDPGPQEGETAFSQTERIRRWIAETGHQLVAVCQDVRQEGRSLGRDGYLALLGIIAAGEVDAVVVGSLEALSSDKIVQEIMIWDLRTRGAAVLSTADQDLPQLQEPPTDKARLLVRDVLARVTEHIERSIGPAPVPPVVEIEEPSGDFVIELIPPDDESRAGSP